MSFGQAILPTKGPMEVMGNMTASNGFNRRTNLAPLKVLGGLGTGELDTWVTGCDSFLSHFCQIDASHPVKFGPAGNPLPAAPEAGPRLQDVLGSSPWGQSIKQVSKERIRVIKWDVLLSAYQKTSCGTV
jgi:hypothetical protein